MKLNFKSQGSGPPLVILHGLFGTLDNWQTIARALQSNWSVYLVDQRNHGKSPHAEEMNYSLMSNDLCELLEDEGIRQAAVLGHSMGGKTAMHFALEYPEMTSSLIIADMGVKEYPAGHDLIFQALEAVHPENLTQRVEAENILSEFIDEAGVRLFLLKNLLRDKATGKFRWKMNLPAIKKAYSSILQAVEADYPYEGPTLFIRGGSSTYVVEQDWPQIQELFPNATLATIPDVGHWLHAEAPKAFTARLLAFLEEQP